jgi:hypothetical protein
MIPGRRVREHALLGLVVALTRAGLYGVGLRFHVALDWMWLADPQDLRDLGARGRMRGIKLDNPKAQSPKPKPRCHGLLA